MKMTEGAPAIAKRPRSVQVFNLAGRTDAVGDSLWSTRNGFDAIDRIIDRYGILEDSMDMHAQAKLMAPDRVSIGQAAGRRTDQAAGMRM